MENQIKAVIFDWAGTTIDYGYMAPKNVFVENSFENTTYFLLNIFNFGEWQEVGLRKNG